jgi:hypothetical protein
MKNINTLFLLNKKRSICTATVSKLVQAKIELKGNSVKIGSSSRCCKPGFFLIKLERNKSQLLSTVPSMLEWEGKSEPVSQKTCRSKINIQTFGKKSGE